MDNLTRIYDKSIYKAIQSYGHDLTIYYSSNASPYAGATDPTNNEPVDYNYSTSMVASTLSVKAVTKTFLGNMSYFDYVLAKQGYKPDADIRVTCWLQDVLMNEDSASGATYFDKSSKIFVGGHYYTVNKTYRTGVHGPTVIILTLNEIKNYGG